MTRKQQQRFEIHTLTKNFLEENLQRFMDIDEDGVPWAKENFLREIPYKWKLSNYAPDGQSVIGFLIASLYEEHTVHLHRIMIDSQYRGRGLGGNMCEMLEESCGQLSGIEAIALHVHKQNSGALSLYGRLGYAITAEMKDEPRYRMEKSLR